MPVLTTFGQGNGDGGANSKNPTSDNILDVNDTAVEATCKSPQAVKFVSNCDELPPPGDDTSVI